MRDSANRENPLWSKLIPLSSLRLRGSVTCSDFHILLHVHKSNTVIASGMPWWHDSSPLRDIVGRLLGIIQQFVLFLKQNTGVKREERSSGFIMIESIQLRILCRIWAVLWKIGGRVHWNQTVQRWVNSGQDYVSAIIEKLLCGILHTQCFDSSSIIWSLLSIQFAVERYLHLTCL